MSKKKTFRLSDLTPLVDVPFDAMVDENDRLYKFAGGRKEREVFATLFMNVLLMAG